ncbi:MAG TPA: type VI secretion system tube protein Hcp [Terriglobales bacterium]|nr:type VI secretion system tube protein Hcp [Terriglobales bacterium]
MQPATRRTITRCYVLLLALIAIAMLPASAAAAVNTYLTLSGISGPSTSKAGAIDLLSFSVSATAPGTSTGTEQATLPSCQVAVTKVLDAASPQLWSAAVIGQHFPTIDIEVVAPLGGQPTQVYKIELKDAYFTKIATSGTADTPTETVTIKASKVSMAFNPLTPTGTIGTTVSVAFTCNVI